MANRMVTIIQTLRPSMLIVRRDLAVPFATAVEAAAVNLSTIVRWVAISEVEGSVSQASAAQLSSRLGVTVWRIFRSDAAFLIAGECPSCRAFHLDRMYRAENVSDRIAIINLGKTCPAIRFDVGIAKLRNGGCSSDPRAQRLEL
jgi:hypothetical protein